MIEGIKRILHQEIMEFVYESEEQRAIHIKYMEKEGWRAGSQVKRMKPDAHIMTATEDDYEWFAEFWKYR
jgi:hypothetical protein